MKVIHRQALQVCSTPSSLAVGHIIVHLARGMAGARRDGRDGGLPFRRGFLALENVASRARQRGSRARRQDQGIPGVQGAAGQCPGFPP